MTAFDPRTDDEIFESLKARLQNRIPKLTNFIETSFNFVFTSSVAEQQHKAEVAAASVQLSGWSDYSGKQLTQEDLDELGITGVNPIEINQFVDSDHLDELGKAFGVSRDPGSRAVGTLEITTLQTTTILEGTQFGTQPDNAGNFIAFETTETVDIDGAQSDFPVPIRAVEVGVQGNVAGGVITYLPDPPVGVDSVVNPQPTSGGADVQSTESLRTDIQNAVVESAEGGTTEGLGAFIENNTDAVSVIVQEFFQGDQQHGQFPHGHVIVFGGTDANVEDAIDFARPSGVQHFLIRPDIIELSIAITVEGGDIDTGLIETAVEDFFDGSDLGVDVFEDKIIQTVMNADTDVENITDISTSVLDETKEFSSGQDVYALDKVVEGEEVQSDAIFEVTGTLNGSANTFVEDTDYREFNDAAGSTDEPFDSIDWSIGGDTPDDGTDFEVSYTVERDITIETAEVAQLDSVTVTEA